MTSLVSPEYQTLGHLPQTPQVSWFHQSSPVHWLLEQMAHAPSVHKDTLNIINPSSHMQHSHLFPGLTYHTKVKDNNCLGLFTQLY